MHSSSPSSYARTLEIMSIIADAESRVRNNDLHAISGKGIGTDMKDLLLPLVGIFSTRSQVSDMNPATDDAAGNVELTLRHRRRTHHVFRN